MSKPRSISIGAHQSMVVEYLRTCGVLRMVNRAGPAPEDHATTRHYMLFAGAGSGGHGGLRDLLGLYDDEEVAKEAFRSTRLSTAYRRGWAELVVFQPERGMEPVCWFGRARSEPVPRKVRPPRRHSVGLSRRRSAAIP